MDAWHDADGSLVAGSGLMCTSRPARCGLLYPPCSVVLQGTAARQAAQAKPCKKEVIRKGAIRAHPVLMGVLLKSTLTRRHISNETRGRYALTPTTTVALPAFLQGSPVSPGHARGMALALGRHAGWKRTKNIHRRQLYFLAKLVAACAFGTLHTRYRCRVRHSNWLPKSGCLVHGPHAQTHTGGNDG